MRRGAIATTHVDGLSTSRSGSPSVQRSCVTTRNDGDIDIEVGQEANGGRVFLSVTID